MGWQWAVAMALMLIVAGAIFFAVGAVLAVQGFAELAG